MNTKKKSRLFAILVAVLMVFAMMPMAAQTAYAEGDIYTVTIEPGDGEGTTLTIDSSTIISIVDMRAGNYDQTKGCFFLDGGTVYYKFPSLCAFTAPEGKEFDQWQASFGRTCSGGFEFVASTFTITALYKEKEAATIDLSVPETISVDYGDTQTAFDIRVESATFPKGNIHILLYNSSFSNTENSETIPFSVNTNSENSGFFAGGSAFYIKQDTILPYTCQGYININSGDWEAADPGTYTGTLNIIVRVNSNDIASYDIPLTLVVPEMFTVTFKADGGSWQDGTTEKTQTVESGQAATAPANPTKEGYTFKGWDTDFSNVTSNMTVKAKWEKKVFVVKFLDEEGAEPIMSQMVEYGDAATAPDDPIKEGYTFKGWDTDFSRITSDTTVTAVWEKNADPQPPAPVSIKDAKVVLSKTAFTYNAKVQKPAIEMIGGKVLAEGTDYTAAWSNNSPKNAGSYTVTITGKGNYTGTTKATYKINKAANPLAIKAKTATVKFSKLKKANQKLAVTKVIKFTKKAGDKKTYIKKSGNSKITIAKKTGKVTVKKGLQKGTYKVKVKVKAAGNTNYKASKVKTVTFTVRVK